MTAEEARRAGATGPTARTEPPLLTGNVANVHPDYAERADEWSEIRDAAEGATAVKKASVQYLPMPHGFTVQSDGGLSMYLGYLTRAQFPEILSPTVQGMVGVIHRVEAKIEMPDSMNYLWEDCDGRGLPLEALHRRVTEEVLLTGRYVLMADAPSAERGGGEVRLRGYVAEDLTNWSEDRDFFVLSESALVRTDFQWNNEDRWRVLRLREGVYVQEQWDAGGPLSPDPVEPRARGEKSMDFIPLVVIGAKSTEVAPEVSPTLGIARCATAIYRLDADLRHQLFMSGQETLFVFGLERAQVPTTVGAGVVIAIDDPGGRAEYVGPSGAGIEAHERAIAAERKNAAALGARIIDGSDEPAGVEAADAKKIRVAATYATLVSVSLSVGRGLEQALRNVALMSGVGEAEAEKITVSPNLDFFDTALDPAAAMQLVAMWQAGAISYETLYENLTRGEIASPERTAEEEQDLISEEAPADSGAGAFDPSAQDAGGGAGGDVTGDVSDEELNSMFSPDALEGA